MKAPRAAVLVVATWVVVSLAVGVVYSAKDGLLMAAFTVGCAAPVIAAAQLMVRRRHRLGSLRRQFVAGVGAVVILTGAGVATVALLMFISSHDASVMVALVVFAGALIAYATGVVASAVMKDIEAVRSGLRAVGEGSRHATIETRARDELADLASSANAMTVRLAESEADREAADEARRTLVAAVSHDLRTPLTSLRLLADAVEDEVGDPATRRGYLEQMSGHIATLSALIEDLFELSRLEAGDIQWSMGQVSLGELVGETVEAMRPVAGAKGVAVEADVPHGVAPARANPEKLQRVLLNLLQNAIRHTPPDGSVTVVAESNGSRVEIEVSDTGQGLAPADRERAFEPFFRGGAEAARPSDGSGLGLTICRAIVEAHGGRIWLADSAVGTRVRFSLPRAG